MPICQIRLLNNHVSWLAKIQVLSFCLMAPSGGHLYMQSIAFLPSFPTTSVVRNEAV